jgi:transcriptional regulator with XRE-family HTH domain
MAEKKLGLLERHDLSHAVRDSCEALSLSQAQLAKRAGVSIKTVQRMEYGMHVSEESRKKVTAVLIPQLERKIEKKRRRYVVTTDMDGGMRSGTVYFGGRLDDDTDCWTGGQVVFHWERRDSVPGPPKRVQRIVDLANQALNKEQS